MVLTCKVKLSQSRKADTQYISVPARMVQDSQYPFTKEQDLDLVLLPPLPLLVLLEQGWTISTEPDPVATPLFLKRAS